MNIHAALKLPYFNSIERGTKKVEYRDMTPYWINKLVDTEKYPNKSEDEIKDMLCKGKKLHAKPITSITFHCNDRVMEVEVLGISVYDHHTTFAIKLGKIIKQ